MWYLIPSAGRSALRGPALNGGPVGSGAGVGGDLGAYVEAVRLSRGPAPSPGVMDERGITFFERFSYAKLVLRFVSFLLISFLLAFHYRPCRRRLRPMFLFRKLTLWLRSALFASDSETGARLCVGGQIFAAASFQGASADCPSPNDSLSVYM